jgi:hypothetical protein
MTATPPDYADPLPIPLPGGVGLGVLLAVERAAVGVDGHLVFADACLTRASARNCSARVSDSFGATIQATVYLE